MSPERVKPKCKYFGECGGCQIQHANKFLQQKIKRNRVVESLKRIGKIQDPDVEVTRSAPNEYAYRNKIVFPLIEDHGVKKIGFFKKRTHDLVSIDHCMLHLLFADQICFKVKKILINSRLRFFNEKEKKGKFTTSCD